MAWSSAPPSGNFSKSNASQPWLPLNRDFAKNNVQRRADAIGRLQQLVAFRRVHFRSAGVEKHGNYLFHYINGGEIVLERYFTTEHFEDAPPSAASRKRTQNGNHNRNEGAAETDSDEASMAMSRSSDAQRLPVASMRSRFVLFANLARVAKTKDLRDKFHAGSILVTTAAKRMRDFLIFRSLKLEPGEAIIARVE